MGSIGAMPSQAASGTTFSETVSNVVQKGKQLASFVKTKITELGAFLARNIKAGWAWGAKNVTAFTSSHPIIAGVLVGAALVLGAQQIWARVFPAEENS